MFASSSFNPAAGYLAHVCCDCEIAGRWDLPHARAYRLALWMWVFLNVSFRLRPFTPFPRIRSAATPARQLLDGFAPIPWQYREFALDPRGGIHGCPARLIRRSRIPFVLRPSSLPTAARAFAWVLLGKLPGPTTHWPPRFRPPEMTGFPGFYFVAPAR